jgi:hypothetical protein
MVIHPCILHQSDFGMCINMMPIHAPKENGVGFFWEICFFTLKLCTDNKKLSNESVRASVTLSRHCVKRGEGSCFQFVRNLLAGLCRWKNMNSGWQYSSAVSLFVTEKSFFTGHVWEKHTAAHFKLPVLDGTSLFIVWSVGNLRRRGGGVCFCAKYDNSDFVLFIHSWCTASEHIADRIKM